MKKNITSIITSDHRMQPSQSKLTKGSGFINLKLWVVSIRKRATTIMAPAMR